MENRETISVKKLSERLGVCINTAYSLAGKKDFYPAYKIGKKICIDADMLEKWISEQGKRKGGKNYATDAS